MKKSGIRVLPNMPVAGWALYRRYQMVRVDQTARRKTSRVNTGMMWTESNWASSAGTIPM